MKQFRPTRFNWWESVESGMPRVFHGGGKSQQSTSQVSIPPEVLAQYQNVNSIANQVAQTPFQQYSQNPNAFVAPLTPTQQAGVLGTNQYSTEAQPFFQQAANLNTPAGVQSYMNPEAGYVQQLMQQQFGQAQQGGLGDAIRNNAFGGDRAAVTAANLQQQQGLAYGNAMAGIYQNAVGNSQNAANLEANIGSGAQAAGLAGAQAQLTAGQAQQQTEQAGLTALYNQFLQQQSYPFQTTQFLANIAEGTGALSGSTTTSNQPAPYFSDERLKEDIEPIGETYDGQKIIKFHYKGQKQKHIGLSAQDVERRHPDAVGLAGGYKTVDYDEATRDAANHGRKGSSGGLVGGMPFRRSDGSIVHERRAFDIGGYAGLSPNAGWAAGFNLDPSYLQAQEAAYSNAPWGNAGPVTGTTPYGGKSHVPPPIMGAHAALAVAKTPSQSNSSGLRELSQGISQVEGLGKAGKSLFNDVKGHIPGLAPSSQPAAAPSAPAPAQSVQMPPDRNPPSSGSASPVAPADTPKMGPEAGLIPNDIGAPPPADLSAGLDDLGDSLSGLFAKRGGLIHRAEGGNIDEHKKWAIKFHDDNTWGPALTNNSSILSHMRAHNPAVQRAIQATNDAQRRISDAATSPSYVPPQEHTEALEAAKRNQRAEEAAGRKVLRGYDRLRKGGLIHRDSGGSTYSLPTNETNNDESQGGDVPYDSGTGMGGLSIPDDASNNKLAIAQPPSQNSGGGGGFNPLSLVTGALGLFGLADGGRVGLAGGGSPDEMPLPSLDDPSVFQQGKEGLAGLKSATPVDADYVNQGDRSLAQALGMSGYEDTANTSAPAAPVATYEDRPSRDIIVHKSAPEAVEVADPAPALPKKGKNAGLNPNVPAPNAQEVQAMGLPGLGNHQTQPGEVLTQDNPGGIGDFLNRNQGLIVPFLHGLGTMASSNSRYLGSAILQGLGGAADSYENVQNEMQQRLGNQPVVGMRQNELLQSELDTWQSYRAQNPGAANLSFPDYEKLKASGRLTSYGGNQAGAAGGSGGASTAGPGDANGPYQFTPQERMTRRLSNGLMAYQDPAYNAGYTAHNAGVNSRYVQGTVHQANHDIGETIGSGFTTNAAGERVAVPGYATTAVAQAQPVAQAQQANDFQKERISFLNDYQREMSLFDELGNVYHQFQAGPTADWRGAVSALANDFDPTGQYPFLHNIPAGNDAENYAKARKDIAQLTASRLSTLPGGAPKAELGLLDQYAAEPNLPPGALRDIIIRGKAALQQTHDYYRGLNPFAPNAPTVPDYQADFYEKHPYERYRGQLEKSTPAFAGQTRANSPELNGGNPKAASQMPAGAPPGTRKAPDGNWYAPDPNRPGKYLRVE